MIEPTREPIEPEIISGLVRYRDQGIPTGGFLRAVLENNLKESVQRADIYNQRALCAIVAWCYNNLPSGSWGSPERVNQWLQKKEKGTRVTNVEVVHAEGVPDLTIRTIKRDS